MSKTLDGIQAELQARGFEVSKKQWPGQAGCLLDCYFPRRLALYVPAVVEGHEDNSIQNYRVADIVTALDIALQDATRTEVILNWNFVKTMVPVPSSDE